MCVCDGAERCQGFPSGGGSFISSVATADVNLSVSDASESELISRLHTHAHTHTPTRSCGALEMDFLPTCHFCRNVFPSDFDLFLLLCSGVSMEN